MSTSNELANPNSAAASALAMMPKSSDLVPDGPLQSKENFGQMATPGNYLPYMKLCGSTSEEAKRGEIGIAHHALYKGKTMIDLGKNVQCWVCAWRPMALLTSGDMPISFFNPQTEGFKKVQAIASRGVFGDGALVGPQFLVFLPDHGFATYFLSSKTAKNEAENFRALIDKCAIVSAQFIENKTHSWHGPVVVASSQTYALPDMEEYKKVLTDFKNPAESKLELADNKPETNSRDQ